MFYFDAMFTSGMKVCASRIIHLELDSATLVGVANYLYTAEVEFSVDNMRRLFETSDLLQLDDLKAACEKFKLERLTAAQTPAGRRLASDA